MNKHDYSMNTFGEISSEILDITNLMENMHLSTENMEYSWASGIVNNVVTWVDVQKIHILKAKLQFILQRADQKLETVAQTIAHIDKTVSEHLDGTLENLQEYSEKFEILNSTLDKFTPALQFKRKEG